jgi:hypothetical protein
MTTNAATNLATQNAQEITFAIDFDKKKWTNMLLHCEAEHRRLQAWLSHPLILARYQEGWRQEAVSAIDALSWGDRADRGALRKTKIQQALMGRASIQQGITRTNNAPARLMQLAGLSPVPVDRLSAQLDAFAAWKTQIQGLAPLYRILAEIYYLNALQPQGLMQTAVNFVQLHQELIHLGFGPVADKILVFYAQQEEILASALASAYHARGKKFHQQPWFQLFFEAWDWALQQLDQIIQAHCFEAVFYAQAQAVLNQESLNDRQHQLLMQLAQEKNTRDKKTLSQTLWYRSLYRGLTKRTQERDFHLLCTLGFVTLRDKQEFMLVGLGYRED